MAAVEHRTDSDKPMGVGKMQKSSNDDAFLGGDSTNDKDGFESTYDLTRLVYVTIRSVDANAGLIKDLIRWLGEQEIKNVPDTHVDLGSDHYRATHWPNEARKIEAWLKKRGIRDKGARRPS